MKRSMIFLSLIFVVFASMVFVGCGEDEALGFSVSQQSIEMTAGQNSYTQIVLTKQNSDVNIWYRVTNEEVVSVSLDRQVGLDYIYTITALNEGRSEVIFTSAENASMKSVVSVQVKSRISTLEFLSDSDIYMIKGDDYKISPTSDFSVSPNSASISGVRYMLEQNDYGLKVDAISGVLDASDVQEPCRVMLTIYSEKEPSIKAETYVSVIEGIERGSLRVVSSLNANEKIYIDGEQVQDIELVKSNEKSNINLDVLVAKYSENALKYSAQVIAGKSVEASITSGRLNLQSVEVGMSTVRVSVVPSIAQDYVEPVSIELEVNVVDLPNTILLNGSTIKTGDINYVYDYYDDGFVGTEMIFTTYPEVSKKASDDKILLSFVDDIDVAQVFRFFFLANGSPVEIVFEDGKAEVNSGTPIYVKAESIETVEKTNYVLVATSEKALKYGLDVSAYVSIDIRKGIETLTPPQDIRLKLRDSVSETFEVFPANADASQVVISTSSEKISVIRNGQYGFSVTANAVSAEEFIYFTKPNGVTTTCKVVVYEVLDMLSVDISSISSGAVSQKRYNASEELTRAVVKCQKDVEIFVTYNEGATISNLSIISSDAVHVRLNKNERTFRCTSASNFRITVTLSGYDENGYDIDLIRTFEVEAYKAITSIDLNTSNALCYASDTVGYFKVQELSKLELNAKVFPVDVTNPNVSWSLKNENGTDVTQSNCAINNQSGLHTTFTALHIDAEESVMILTAQVVQYGETFTASCKIRVKKAEQINRIVSINVPNNNVYFDSRKGMGEGTTNKAQVICAVYPSNALNHNVRYEYRSENDTAVDDSDKIYKIDASTGEVIPLKAGKAKLLVCAEDSYVSSSEASRYLTIWVTVQDGKTKDTAFHVSNANELRDIGKNAETMDYFYVLTQDIDLKNEDFSPLGSAGKVVFTGELSGKMQYEYDGEIKSNLYKITNLRITKTMKKSEYTSNENKFGAGLFYGLGNGEKIGRVEDLTIEYSGLTVDMSSIDEWRSTYGAITYNIGGVAGIVNGKAGNIEDNYSIKNVRVIYDEFIYTASSYSSVGAENHIAYIGGLVGYMQAGSILYDQDFMGPIVSGEDIVVKNIKTSSILYIGGMVGRSNDLCMIQSRFKGMSALNSEEGTQFSSSFENQDIDVTINVCNVYKGVNYAEAIISQNSAVGGIVGLNYGSISNCATENVINAYSNVGGIVGIMQSGTVSDCFSASKLRGNANAGQNVGGIVGYLHSESNSGDSIISLCYVQNYDDSNVLGINLPLIKGYDYLGGIIGRIDNANADIEVSYCYASSYIDRALVGSENEANNSNTFLGNIYSSNASLASVHCGGVVGGISNGASLDSVKLLQVFSNFVSTIYNSSHISLVGTAQKTQIKNSYVENLIYPTITTSLIFGDYENMNISTSVEVYKTNDDGITISVVGDSSHNYGSISNIEATDIIGLNANDNDVWNIEDGKLPYIKIGSSNMVEQAPDSIVAEGKANATSVLQAVGDSQLLVLEYLKAQDLTEQRLLDTLNIHEISAFLDIQSLPRDNYTKRYVVSSSDVSVVSVTQDGRLRINDIGNTNLQIRSRLNARKYVEIKIFVIYKTDTLGLYENAINTGATLSEINVYLNQSKQIYPLMAQSMVNIGGREVLLYNQTDCMLEYTFASAMQDFDTAGNGASKYIDIDSNISNNTTNIAYNKPQVVTGKEHTTKRIDVSIMPYVIWNGNKVYLAESFQNGNVYNVQNMPLNVVLGATAISIVDSHEFSVNAGDQVEFTMRVYTTKEDDSLSLTLYDQSNAYIDSFYTSSPSDTQVVHMQCEINNANFATSNYIDFRFRVRLKDDYRNIRESKTIRINFISDSNYSLKDFATVVFNPVGINRIDSKFFTYAQRDLNSSAPDSYNVGEVQSDMILPGTDGLLMLNLFPFYADFDYVNLTSDEKLAFTQVLRKGEANATTYPYEDYNEVSYLSNGIKLANVYYENGRMLYGKNGEYYVLLSVPANSLSPTYHLHIKAFKQSDLGENQMVFSKDLELKCINMPVINISYEGENRETSQEIYIPTGVTRDINISVLNADSEPSIKVNKIGDTSIYPYASIRRDANGYKIVVNKNATFGDKIRVTVSSTKQVGERIQSVSNYIDFIIVPYIILDLGFEYVYKDTMREVFGGNYALRLSYKNSRFLCDETNSTVLSMIQSDFAKVSTTDYNTWYVHSERYGSASDVIGKYFKNDYLEIKTKSAINKDLYLSGIFYDETMSHQKMIGVHLQYYYDDTIQSWFFSKNQKNGYPSSVTEPYKFDSKKSIVNGRYCIQQSKYFFVSLYPTSSIDNAKPIYNVGEFQAMEADKSYILMRDLELINFTPIKNNILYLNGNNKTITITSFAHVEGQTLDVGIFSNISENAIVENLQLKISSKLLKINAEDKSIVTFGLLASVNNGKIYNCSITYTGELSSSSNSTIEQETANGSTQYSQDFNSEIGEDIDVSGNMIGNNVSGIAVQISVVSMGETYVNSTMGALVGRNAGYITNCRVQDGLILHAYGVVGGLVGQNLGTIASSYSRARVYSYTTIESYSNIGGFVGKNTGKITLSFVEQLSSAPSVTSINAICKVGGFVCENDGEISNCYSNIKISSNSSTAGFVYDNIDGKIYTSYSASKVREDSRRDTPFVGVDSLNELNYKQGNIVDCYFLQGRYANQDLQPATKLTSDQFESEDVFTNFSFSNEIIDDGFKTSGVWFIPQKATGISVYSGQLFKPKMPTLVAPNLISVGYVDLLSTTTDKGVPIYNYSAVIGATLGEKNHPYVVYSAEQYNRYIKEANITQKENGKDYITNNKHYVFACDLIFDGNTRMAESYYTNFSGFIDGNGMNIKSLRLSYLDYVNQASSQTQNEYSDIQNFGLFKTLENAIIQNIVIDVDEVYGSVVQNVGAVAGSMKSSKIFNIDLSGDAIIQGRNMVGGLVGYAGTSNQVSNITSSLSLNAVYRSNTLSVIPTTVSPTTTSEGEESPTTTTEVDISYEALSYAGGIIGYSEGSTNDNRNTYNALKINEKAKILGLNVGGLIGHLGIRDTLENSSIRVKSDMYLKGETVIGGLVAVSFGTIKYSSLAYEDNDQREIGQVQNIGPDGSITGVGTIKSTPNNKFFIINIDNNYQKSNGCVIGGLVGLNVNLNIEGSGNIEACFNKVNIIDKKAVIMGGITGVDCAGSYDLCYASSLIDAGEFIQDTHKAFGGLIGAVSYNLVKDSYKVTQAKKDTTNIKNSVSTAQFNKAHADTHIREESENEEVNYLKIGGLIGASIVSGTEEEQKNKIKYENCSYHKQICDRDISDLGSAGDIALSSIGAQVITSTTDPFNIINSRNSEGEEEGHSIGYYFAEMISDGFKRINEQEAYYTYDAFKVESSLVSGRKTEIFSAFVIDGYFHYESENQAYPALKAVHTLNSIPELFQTLDYKVYLQGSDLMKLSFFTHSEKRSANEVSFDSYTFEIKTDAVLSDSFRGIGTDSKPFKGTINGKGHTISGLTLGEDCSGFIVFGSGIQLNSIAFADVSLNAQTETCNNKNFALISLGLNVSLNAVSVSVKSISMNNNVGIKFGGFVGELRGRYNVISNSYVIYDVSNLNSMFADVNPPEVESPEVASSNENIMGGFVAAANPTAQLSLYTCYMANTGGGIAIPLTRNVMNLAVNNVLVHNNIDKDSALNVVDGTAEAFISGNDKYYLSSRISNNIFNSISDNMVGHQYKYDKLEDLTLFSDVSGKWDPTNVWKNVIFTLDEGSIFPRHNFAQSYESVYNGIGSYDESTKTYTIENSLGLNNLSNAINLGVIPNGGLGYTFKLGNTIDGNYYAVDTNGTEYYIYDYDSNVNSEYNGYILYDNVITNIKVVGNKVKFKVNNENYLFDLYNKPMQSIGNYTNAFKGKFVGEQTSEEPHTNSCTIKNILIEANVSSADIAYGGLFGVVKDAVIRDFNIGNISINLSNVEEVNTYYVGGLAGYINASYVENVIQENGTKIVFSKVGVNIKYSLNCGSIFGCADVITLKNVKVLAQGSQGLLSILNNNGYDNSEGENVPTTNNVGILIGYLACDNSFIEDCTGSNVYNDVNTYFGHIYYKFGKEELNTYTHDAEFTVENPS